MTEPEGAGGIEFFGGVEGPQETDESLDAAAAQFGEDHAIPAEEVPTEAIMEAAFPTEDPAPTSEDSAPATAEAAPQEGQAQEAVEGDSELSLYEQALQPPVEPEAAEGEAQTVSLREHELAVELAAAQARIEAAEQQALPQQQEEAQPEAPEPINYASPEVVAALRDKFPSLSDEELPALAQTLGIFAETAADNKIKPIEEQFSQQGRAAEEAAQAQQLHAIVEGNLVNGTAMAAEQGDLETEIVEHFRDDPENSLLANYLSVMHEDSQEDGTTSPYATSHGVALAVVELAREIRGGQAQPGESPQEQVTQAPDGSLVGSREAVTAAMSKAPTGSAQTTQTEEKDPADILMEAALAQGDHQRAALGDFS